MESVVIAKMDGSANEHTALSQVEGYPTLLFYPAGAADQEPVRHHMSLPKTVWLIMIKDFFCAAKSVARM